MKVIVPGEMRTLVERQFNISATQATKFLEKFLDQFDDPQGWVDHVDPENLEHTFYRFSRLNKHSLNIVLLEDPF